MKEIRVREFGEIDLDLGKKDLRYMRKVMEQTKQISLHPLGGTKYRIRVGPMAGFISLSRVKIRLMPKIPYISIFYLIARSSSKLWSHSHTIKLKRIEEEGLYVFHHFLKLIEEFVPRLIRRRYHQKLIKGTNVRGKIDRIKTLRENISGSIKIISETDDFSEDQILNQILKFTIRKSISIVRGMNPSLSKQFVRQYHKLKKVTSRDFTIQEIENAIEGLKRQDNHYQPILTLCLLIASGHSIGQQVGNVVFSTFILNMNKLYETFVFRVVADYLREFSVRSNVSLRVTAKNAKLIVYRPDILITEERRNITMVGDAKYKFVDLSQKELRVHADFYQILSYALFQNSKFGVLFYPGVEKETSKPVIFKFHKYGVTIWIVSLPLGNVDWNLLDHNISKTLLEIKEEVFKQL
ncbi:MAG: hypothetical protein D6732_06245 [Methanobacteriota archaeon]|nr:MAG: hypothetical protein D6732_06245 [Euryarchaeota archaeon]